MQVAPSEGPTGKFGLDLPEPYLRVTTLPYYQLERLSVYNVLAYWAGTAPDAPAIGAPGREMLTYGGLLEQIESTVRALRSWGISESDRVIVALPQGPELAVAVVAVAAGAVAAPVDPNGRVEAYEVLFADMQARAAIVESGVDTPAAAAAARTGLQLIEISGNTNVSGRFHIRRGPHEVESPTFGGPDDLSLFLRTSGTTSQSKIVPLTHRQFLSAADNTRRALGLTSADRLLNPMPLFHGHGLVAGVFSSLMAGASAICTPRFEVDLFFAWLEEFAPTWFTAVPTIHQAILQEAPLRRDLIARCPLRLIRSASAFLPASVRSGLENVFGVPVTESYGLSEALQLTNTPLDRERRKPGSLGLPGTSEIAIMNDSGEFLPAGQEGEIVARGPVVMSGYLNTPTGSDDVFRNGWFRTGDLGYIDEDGHLYMTGRIKDMINRGGEKISPQEIDTVLLRHSAVAHALAFGVDHPTLGEDVEAAVVLHQGAAATAEELRGHARQYLPDFKVPRRIHIVASIPSNATGKLLRRELARHVVEQKNTTAFRAPQTEVEHQLASIWQSVLNVTAIGVDDDFFELGGQSLLAARIAARIRAELGAQVSVATLFEAPTIARLAASIERGSPRTSAVVSSRRIASEAPLSFAQQRLWILHRMEPESTAYNMLRTYRLEGQLDTVAFIQAANAVVRRHESLRTTFNIVDGEPVQIVIPATELSVPVVDLESVPLDDRIARVNALLEAEANRPFDLTEYPLLRIGLVRLAADEHLVTIAMHHIISDGWSMGIFIRELSECYAAYSAGREPCLEPLQLQYPDYAVWQHRHVTEDLIARQLEYWRRHLEGAPDLITLPLDRPRPSVATGHGQSVRFSIGDDLRTRLRSLCRAHGVTLHQLLLATFHVLLSRYCGQNEIVTGTPSAGRGQVELEPLIGFFVNTLAIRSTISPDDTFVEHLLRVKQNTLRAYEHQDVPFERVVESLKPRRTRAYSPVFQVMFIVQNNEQEAWSLPGIRASRVDEVRTDARFDLTLSFEEGRDLTGTLIYRTDLFERSTAERISDSIQTLLHGIAAAPSSRIADLPLVGPAERARLLQKSNSSDNTLAPGPRCLHVAFQAWAAEAPDRIALRCGERELTAAELNEQCNRLAHRLIGIGIGPDDVVGLVFERSVEAIVALLGILKAGGAYLPIDPAWPDDRVVAMLRDARASAVVVQPGLLLSADCDLPMVRYGGLSDLGDEPTHNPDVTVQDHNLAYVIFTSGSTGRPKGVGVEHRQVMNYVLGLKHRLQLPDGISCATVSTLAADLGNTSVFTALAGGGCLHVITQSAVFDGAELAAYFDRHQVDLLKITPSHLAALQSYNGDPSRLMPRRVLVFGGEALRSKWVEDLARAAPHCAIFNHYGPTETTIGALTYRVCVDSDRHGGAIETTSGTVPLGQPLPNVRTYIVDGSLELVPDGVSGELLIGGAGVARGYVGRPDLTNERFVPDPFSESRLYRTGDLVRRLSTGDIEFLGRIDDQVKIRGYRVEPGEVQSVLMQHESVAACAVAAVPDHDGTNVLVAYVVGDDVDIDRLKSYARMTLPEYMVPSAFVRLDSLPLTPNGKLDRKALQLPARITSEDRISALPRNALELKLVEIFAEAVGKEQIGIDDNFFELGGHSLAAIRMFARISREFDIPVRSAGGDRPGRDLNPAILWDAPTVRQLASILADRTVVPGGDRVLIPVRREGDKPPVVVVAGDWDGLGFYVRSIAERLDPNRPVYALMTLDLSAEGAPQSFVEVAAYYVSLLRSERPHGPYILGGYSASGVIAMEMARLLVEAGEEVISLVVIDTMIPHPRWQYVQKGIRLAGRLLGRTDSQCVDMFVNWRYRVENFSRLRLRGTRHVFGYYLNRLRGRSIPADTPDEGEDWREYPGMLQFVRMKYEYVPRRYGASVTLIAPRNGNSTLTSDPTLGWRSVASNVVVLPMEGDHSTCLKDHISETATLIRGVIEGSPQVAADEPAETLMTRDPRVAEAQLQHAKAG